MAKLLGIFISRNNSPFYDSSYPLNHKKAPHNAGRKGERTGTAALAALNRGSH
jgi:hypothetical protein